MRNIFDIWFSRIEIANSIKLKLLEHFSTESLWKFGKDEFLQIGIKESTIKEIVKKEYRENLDKYKTYLEKHRIDLICFKENDYPWKLKHILDLPAYIFVKGNKNILDDEAVAIIGSRNCTDNGKKIAFSTAKELGDKNINVVSGLAIRYR